MSKLDGWITIGTKLSTDKFDKQLADLENKIDSEEKKQELLNRKTSEYTKELREAKREVFDLAGKLDGAKKKANELKDSMIKIQNANPRKGAYEIINAEKAYKEQSKRVDELQKNLDKAKANQSNLLGKVRQTRLQYDKSVKSADRLRGKIETISLTRHNKEVNQLTNGVGSAIKKVGKLALAVLSVRSAYSFLRQASSTWGQYNEQYARDLEYIRFALASGIAPVLEKIVSLVQTLMAYINYLSNAWFGKTLFASAKDFEKMSKSASGVAKSTKEIKNNLASFDELNILTQSGASGEAGEGFLMPSFDLGNFEDIEIPEWIKWLGDHGEEVKNSLIGIGTAIGAMKLSQLASNLGLVANKLSLIKGIGVAVAVEGVAEGVKDLKIYMEDPTLENFGKTISDIGQAVIGFGIATGNLPVVAGGGLIWLTGKFVENWEEIRDTTQRGIDFLREKAPEIEKIFGKTGAQIYTDVLDTSEDVLNTVDTTISLTEKNFRNFLGIIDALQKGDWTTAWNEFKDTVSNTWDMISTIIETKINAISRFINLLIDRSEAFINNFIDGLNNLGANINHVNFTRLPIADKKTVTNLPTLQELGVQGPKMYGPEYQTTFSQDVSSLASTISEKFGDVKQDISIKFEGTMAQFVRALKPEIEVENNRVGTKMITGGAN